MNVPDPWRSYNCEDYFSSRFAEVGFRGNDPLDPYPYIEPAANVFVDPDRGFLPIGGPGSDGIRWGYRKNMQGLWAYLPIDGEFLFLAPDVHTLVEGWMNGNITM